MFFTGASFGFIHKLVKLKAHLKRQVNRKLHKRPGFRLPKTTQKRKSIFLMLENTFFQTLKI